MRKKIYKCDIKECEKLFSSKFSLKRHNLIHLNKKSHICKHCQKAFSLPQYLEEHEYTHTGAKPFVCNVGGCQDQFRQRGKLSIHRKIYHTDHINANRAAVLGQNFNLQQDPQDDEALLNFNNGFNQHQQYFQQNSDLHPSKMESFTNSILNPEINQQNYGSHFDMAQNAHQQEMRKHISTNLNGQNQNSMQNQPENEQHSISNQQFNPSSNIKIGSSQRSQLMNQDPNQIDYSKEELKDDSGLSSNPQGFGIEQQLQKFGQQHKVSQSDLISMQRHINNRELSQLENQQQRNLEQGRTTQGGKNLNLGSMGLNFYGSKNQNHKQLLQSNTNSIGLNNHELEQIKQYALQQALSQTGYSQIMSDPQMYQDLMNYTFDDQSSVFNGKQNLEQMLQQGNNSFQRQAQYNIFTQNKDRNLAGDEKDLNNDKSSERSINSPSLRQISQLQQQIGYLKQEPQ